MLSAFDLVLVINLKSRPDRLKEIRAQLNGVGHDFGDRIRVLPASRPADAGGFRSIGAHGCFRSHMSCLAEAVRENASSLLILEDDVDFVRSGFESQEVTEYLAQGKWDIFYGGYGLEESFSIDTAPHVSAGLRLAAPGLPIGLTHFVAFHGETISSLHDYLGAMIARPPGHPDGGPMDVDGAYNWFRKSALLPRTILADPQLAFQRASPSDVTARRWYDRIPPFDSVARVARSLRSQLVKKSAGS